MNQAYVFLHAYILIYKKVIFYKNHNAKNLIKKIILIFFIRFFYQKTL